LPPDDREGWRHLRRHSSIPLAGGETLCTRFGFRDPIAQRQFDIAQPDVSLCGGLTEALAIAQIASAWHVRVSPHVWSGAIGLAASLQFAAMLSDLPFGDVVPEPLWFEWDRGENPLRDALLTKPLTAHAGAVAIPDGPGLGVEVDPAAVADFLIQ
jgi:D-galactarolactone cycloisomerase